MRSGQDSITFRNCYPTNCSPNLLPGAERERERGTGVIVCFRRLEEGAQLPTLESACGHTVTLTDTLL